MKKGITILAVTFSIMCLSIISFGQKNSPLNPKEDQTTIYTRFSQAQAYTEGIGVYVRWRMETESNNIGFNVYKVNFLGKVRVNPNLIGGAFLTNMDEAVNGLTYSFFDPSGGGMTTYFVETLGVDGKTISSDYIYPQFVKDMTEVAGLSTERMTKAASQQNNLVEKESLNLPKELSEEIDGFTLPPDPVNQKFIASQPGVKIGVRQEGIYRVTQTELANGGFDTNQPSANWKLYVNGVEQSITIGANNAYIEFYGKGVDDYYTGTQIYYLINSTTPGKRIQTRVRRGIGGSVITPSFTTRTIKEDRVLYLSNIRNGGETSNFVSDKLVNATGSIIDFSVKDIDFNRPTMKLTVEIQGFTLLPHNIEVKLNGNALGNITGSNQNLMTGVFNVPSSMFVSGTNGLSLQTVAGSSDISFMKSISVDYDRKYVAQGNRISFYTASYRNAVVMGFSSRDIRVFDTSRTDAPVALSNLPLVENGSDNGVVIPANRSGQFFATHDSQILQAVSITQNSPSTLSTAAHNAEFVIISYKDWMTEANNWGNYRINEGVPTKVVNVEDIYDEFGYGRSGAQPIKDFLQYAHSNWQTPPQYILLMGDTTYDPRDYENRGTTSYIPVQFVDTLYEETGSDEAMADFDNDGLAELAIGRIPNQNPASLTLALTKTQVFEQTVATGLGRGAMFASDCPNGYDFVGLSQRLANELPSGTSTFMVNRQCPDQPVIRTQLLNQLDVGNFIVNYSGHGSTGLWATVGFYSLPDATTIANGSNYSIFTMLTCLNGYFLRTGFNSLSEELLFAPNGGAVIVWSSTGKTTPDVQEVLAKKFYQNIGNSTVMRIGDSIKISKQNLVGGRDVRLSWGLLGDPMLKLR